jgi:hypothetical protein
MAGSDTAIDLLNAMTFTPGLPLST